MLAAGLSERMGVQKLLLSYGDSTIIEKVLENLRLSGLTPVSAVFSQEIAQRITARPPWLKVAVNPEPQRGQSSSLAIGLSTLRRGEDFCIMLGDLPAAGAAGMKELYQKFIRRPPGCSVLAPSRDGAFGHPMFYAAVWRERFAAAQGDMGGKEVLKRYWNEIAAVHAADGHFMDIDTPRDYLLASGLRGDG